MRYSASEKLEIIRLVEQSHLPVRRTLGQIGIPRSTFYRWYDQYQTGGPEALDAVLRKRGLPELASGGGASRKARLSQRGGLPRRQSGLGRSRTTSGEVTLKSMPSPGKAVHDARGDAARNPG